MGGLTDRRCGKGDLDQQPHDHGTIPELEHRQVALDFGEPLVDLGEPARR